MIETYYFIYIQILTSRNKKKFNVHKIHNIVSSNSEITRKVLLKMVLLSFLSKSENKATSSNEVHAEG